MEIRDQLAQFMGNFLKAQRVQPVFSIRHIKIDLSSRIFVLFSKLQSRAPQLVSCISRTKLKIPPLR